MPRALQRSKKNQIQIVLKSDEGINPQPVFLYEPMNGRQWLEVAEATEIMDGETNPSHRDVMQRIYSACRVALVGWENMIDPDTKQPIPFDPEKLEEIIDPMEAMSDLLPQLLEANQLSEDDKKN